MSLCITLTVERQMVPAKPGQCDDWCARNYCYTLPYPPLHFFQLAHPPLLHHSTTVSIPTLFKPVSICYTLPGQFWRTWRWYCSARIPWILAALQGCAGILSPGEWYLFLSRLSVEWFVRSSPTRASEIRIFLKKVRYLKLFSHYTYNLCSTRCWILAIKV